MKKINAPKATQLPSGSWFCRVRMKGIDQCITAPTKKEAERQALAVKMGYLEAQSKEHEPTVTECIDEYIDARRKKLSPATIRSYRGSQRNQLQSLMNLHADDLTDKLCQTAVNAESCGAKTLKNAWTLIAAAVKFKTGKTFNVYLPKIVQEEHEFLQPEQIPVFCEAIKQTPVETAALLALHSLRRSEIMGLKWANVDLQKNVLYVHGSSVYDENGDLVNKPDNKNASSRRTVPIMMPQLREALEREQKTAESEFVIPYHVNNILRWVDKTCEKTGLPKVGVHGLRHSFCSLAYHLGVPEKTTMKIGGWSDYQTMRKIYTHVADTDLASAALAMANFYSKNDNEIPTES